MSAQPAKLPKSAARDIEERRRELSLTDEELAARAGLDVRVVRGLQHGDQGTPSTAAVAALAKALEMRPEDLDVVLPDMDTADLATLRRSRGLNAAHIAELVGKSPRHVHRVEAGLRLPDDPRLYASAYGISESQLAAVWKRGKPQPRRGRPSKTR